MQFLNSFVEEKIISNKDYSDFLNSLNTVSKQLSNDLLRLSKKEFLKIYGHLRPGTYDIMSSRYDEAYEMYFKSMSKTKVNAKKDKFDFTAKQKIKISKLIKNSGLKTSVDDLLLFIKEAIEGREYSKFIFTRSLSQVIIYTEMFGSRLGFSKKDLAYLNIQKILDLYSTLDHRNVAKVLSDNINKNKDFYQYTKSIKLPSLIVEANDIYSFNIKQDEPNFITLKKIQSSVVLEQAIPKENLDGKIVCIRSADPGYDYLFSKNIGGLITCFGGANSHMGIRCAEIGIPAVIGCGEIMFEKYSKATLLAIDASNKTVKVIS